MKYNDIEYHELAKLKNGMLKNMLVYGYLELLQVNNICSNLNKIFLKMPPKNPRYNKVQMPLGYLNYVISIHYGDCSLSTPVNSRKINILA